MSGLPAKAQSRKENGAKSWGSSPTVRGLDRESSARNEHPSTGTAGIPPAMSAGGADTPGSTSSADAIYSYRAVVVGGRIDWTNDWAQRLSTYVRNGDTVVLNAAQLKGLSSDLLGIRLIGSTAEADIGRCRAKGEPPQDLAGQLFRYERVEPKAPRL